MDANAAAPGAAEPMAPDVAIATIAQRRADPAFVARFGAGDAAARAEFSALHLAAYPEPTPDEATGSTPAAPIDDGYGPVPESPERYRLDYPVGVDIPKEVDAEVRDLFHAAQLPESYARHFFSAGNKITELPSPGALELAARKTEFDMTQAHGAEGYKARLAAARSVIDALPDGKRQRAKLILERSGLGSDRHLIERLADLAERRAARKGA